MFKLVQTQFTSINFLKYHFKNILINKFHLILPFIVYISQGMNKKPCDCLCYKFYHMIKFRQLNSRNLAALVMI